MQIKFNPDATDSFAHVLDALVGYTVVGEFTNNGFPSLCRILRTDEVYGGIVVCEIDEDGEPFMPNSTWAIGYDEITSITVL